MGVRTTEEIIQLVKKYMNEGKTIKEREVWAIYEIVKRLEIDEEVLCAFKDNFLKFDNVTKGTVVAFTNRRIFISRVLESYEKVEVNYPIYETSINSLYRVLYDGNKFLGANFKIVLFTGTIEVTNFSARKIDYLIFDIRNLIEQLGIGNNVPVSDKAKEIVDMLNERKRLDYIELGWYYSAEEIAKVLMPDEHIMSVFDGLKIDGGVCTIITVTDRRVIFGMKINLISGQSYYKVYSLDINRCCSCELNEKLLSDEILIYNEQRQLYFRSSPMTSTDAMQVFNLLRYAIEQARRYVPQAVIPQGVISQTNVPQEAPVQLESVADEIKKFKELLDLGAITQEEFDAKKKRLLGL